MSTSPSLARRLAGPIGLGIVIVLVALDIAWGDERVVVVGVVLGGLVLASLALAARSHERLDDALAEVESLEARMAAALGGLAEAVTMQDPDGNVVFANAAAAVALGYRSADELMTTPRDDLIARFAMYRPDGSVMPRAEMPGRLVFTDRPADPVLVRVVDTHTGDERWRITKATAVRNAEGEPVLAVNVIEDVTEVKRAELAQRALAETLQASLLPDALPEIPGFELAALYRPAGDDAFVGGDFYDSFPAGDGWMLVVGDVTGRGVEAAALTAQARFTLRTAAQLLGDPAAAVAELNRALTARPDLPLCTVAMVALTDDHATIVCAGHPPTLLVRDGRVEALGETAPLVGAWSDATWTAHTVDLRPDDVLVLYTDGVIDAMGEGERYGETRLASALTDVDGADAAVVRIRAELQAFERGPQVDDTAILALRRLPVAVPAAS
jgi:PAS domain S-box-containing protein